MKRITLFLIALSFSIIDIIQAQNEFQPTVSSNICVSSSDIPKTEIHISLDRANPDNLILCANTPYPCSCTAWVNKW